MVLVMMVLTSALHSGGRSEGSPERFGTHLTAGRHVEADGHKLVALQHHRHDLVPVCVGQDGRRGVVVRLPGLSLTSVQDLSDNRPQFTLTGQDSPLTWKILGMSFASARMTSP